MPIPSQRQRSDGQVRQRKDQEPRQRDPNPEVGSICRNTNQARVASHEQTAPKPAAANPADCHDGEGIPLQANPKGHN